MGADQGLYKNIVVSFILKHTSGTYTFADLNFSIVNRKGKNIFLFLLKISLLFFILPGWILILPGLD